MCGETFSFTYELEIHLKKHKVETFKCEKCEKTFYLKWRLEKHKKAHDLVDVKFWHYFNINKPCPFDEVGCMFRHDKSKNVNFRRNVDINFVNISILAMKITIWVKNILMILLKMIIQNLNVKQKKKIFNVMSVAN